MEIFDVKEFPVQGHSIRCYAGKIGKHQVQSSVKEFIEKEIRDKIFLFRPDNNARAGYRHESGAGRNRG